MPPLAKCTLYALQMPTHSPEPEGAYYEADTVEIGPGGQQILTVVKYLAAKDDGYAFDPDAEGETEWSEDGVLSEPSDTVYWDNDGGRRVIATEILRHHLKGEPSDDSIDTFLVEFAGEWQDGIPWILAEAKISGVGFSKA